MDNFSQGRVTPARAFLRTGIDYAGSILIRTNRGRGHRSHKAFIAIFVCLCSKTTHLEVVSDYTTDAFLTALRRFTACRELCSDIYSDCGTNFIGADRYKSFFVHLPSTAAASRMLLSQKESDGTSILLPHLTSEASGKQQYSRRSIFEE